MSWIGRIFPWCSANQDHGGFGHKTLGTWFSIALLTNNITSVALLQLPPLVRLGDYGCILQYLLTSVQLNLLSQFQAAGWVTPTVVILLIAAISVAAALFLYVNDFMHPDLIKAHLACLQSTLLQMSRYYLDARLLLA